MKIEELLLMGSELIEEGYDYDTDYKPIHPYLEYLVVTDHEKQKINIIEQKEYTTRFIYSFIKLIRELGGICDVVSPLLYSSIEEMMNDFAALEDYENAIYLRDELLGVGYEINNAN